MVIVRMSDGGTFRVDKTWREVRQCIYNGDVIQGITNAIHGDGTVQINCAQIAYFWSESELSFRIESARERQLNPVA